LWSPKSVLKSKKVEGPGNGKFSDLKGPKTGKPGNGVNFGG